MKKPLRFVSLGRQRLNKAFRARDIERVKEHTKRELSALQKLYGKR